MRIWRLVFVLIGLAGMAVAMLQPEAPSPQAQRAHIQAALEKHGYVVSGQVDIGKALTITKFSYRDCDNVRVLPVSILFQETALLRNSENAGDDTTFVYMNREWKDAASRRMALSHLEQTFLQMTRWTPVPALDTMLYIAASKKCRPGALDWSRFWATGA
jgi:hypothetical protein